MTAPQNFKWTFRDVLVYSKDVTYVIAGHDPSGKKELPGSALFRWAGSWSAQPFALNATGVAVTRLPDINVLVMGVDGRIGRWGKGLLAEEIVDASEEGPQHWGDLREIRTIGNHAYIVGMRRTAYRCEAPGQWSRIDQGVRCSDEDESEAGFNSIDGFSETEIYSVGWGGEIWMFNGKKWKHMRSPTNLALFRVICAPDGKVYACGQKGTVVAGRGDKWSTFEPHGTEETLWGATYFRGHPYFCTTDNVLSPDGDALKVVPIVIKQEGKARTIAAHAFYKLNATEDVLWSVGSKMALYTTDGLNWLEPSYPGG